MSLFAEEGWRRPSVTDGGLVTEPLVARSAEELAAAATMTVVCPSFPVGSTSHDYFTSGLGAELEATHPVVPFAIRVAEEVPAELVALVERAPVAVVRDAVSRDRLLTAGVTRAVEVIPHPAVLLDRIVDLDSLPVRTLQLRQLGVLPDGEYDVLALREAPTAEPAEGQVVLPVGEPFDGFLPADLVFEDRLAVLASARSVRTTDEHVAAACVGLGVNCASGRELGELGEVAALRAQLDRVAEVASQTFAERGGDLDARAAALAEENQALRQAHWRLRQRMLVERERLVEPLAEALLERDAAATEAAELRERNLELARRNEELSARLAHVERELSAWQNTKLVRWTRPLRDVYGKARG